jgi:hypothetical protein
MAACPNAWSEIERLEVPVDGAAILELLGSLDKLTAKIGQAVSDFESAELRQADGAVQ